MQRAAPACPLCHGAPGQTARGQRGAGTHLAGVWRLSPNTSGQMSVGLTELVRQGAGKDSAALTPQVLGEEKLSWGKISKSQGWLYSGSPWVTPEMSWAVHPSP